MIAAASSAGLPWRVLRFAVVGTGVTLFNFALYVGLIAMGAHYLVATVAGWAIGVAVAFHLNRTVTFRLRTRTGLREVWSFLATYVAQLALGTATLVLMIDGLGIEYRIAFFVNVAITALFSFTLMDRVVFRRRG